MNIRFYRKLSEYQSLGHFMELLTGKKYKRDKTFKEINKNTAATTTLPSRLIW
jgi:hypothetical protein